jgi:hypothetical protein
MGGNVSDTMTRLEEAETATQHEMRDVLGAAAASRLLMRADQDGEGWDGGEEEGWGGGEEEDDDGLDEDDLDDDDLDDDDDFDDEEDDDEEWEDDVDEVEDEA